MALKTSELGMVEKYIKATFSLISKLILLTVLLFSLYEVGVIILIPIFTSILIRSFSEYFEKKGDYIREHKLSVLEKKNAYLHHICEDESYAKEIRIFSLLEPLQQKLRHFERERMKIWKAFLSTFRYNAGIYHIAELLLSLCLYLILGKRYLDGRIGLDLFVFYFGACIEIQNAMGDTFQSAIDIHMNLKYVENFLSFIGSIATPSSPQSAHVHIRKDAFEIKFDHVCFQYPNAKEAALKDVNVTLKSGEVYLLVGENGSGKSTLVNLMTGILHPTSGTISMNGTPIDVIPKEDYYALISMYFQNAKAMELSLADNITSMDDAIDEDRLSSATSKAMIAEKIEKTSKGLQSQYGRRFDPEGLFLSGGEEQKLLIAKALYKNGCIRIFDEPTSKIDPLTEIELFEHLKQDADHTLTIFVTHRMSLGKEAEHIIVMDKGKISAIGTHDTLYGRDTSYTELFDSQKELYQ